jgi:hypothetical protein
MRWTGLPLVDGPHFALDTASISVLAYEPSHPDSPVIERWNFTSLDAI